jgi:biopolymer transport protein ExbB
MSLISLVRASFAAVLITATTLAATLPTPAAAQAPAASAPAATGKPAVTQEAVENPYGLKALWEQGDAVAHGTLIIMLIMSMGSWYVIFTKLYEQGKMLKSARSSTEAFWKASSVKEGLHALEEGSASRFITEQALKADDHHEGTMVATIDRHTWVSMNIDRAVGSVQSRLQGGLAILATVGSTAPFVGLFGTVWGIYNALVKIGISGQASIDKVAGPVGEALIMTAIGLAVAVPAVMGYNWLIRRNKAIMDATRAFAADLHSVLIAGKR